MAPGIRPYITDLCFHFPAMVPESWEVIDNSCFVSMSIWYVLAHMLIPCQDSYTVK